MCRKRSAGNWQLPDRELARVAAIARQTLGFYKDNSKHRWVPVAEVIEDVLTIYDRKMMNKHLEVRIVVDPKLTVYARHGELKQALSNLVANAIDASQDCGKLRLRAQATKKDNVGYFSHI
jgi:C4-dicarboxylate-specific signal transduction histidine kinase